MTQVPEGWQLVPKTPTKEMIEASWDMAGTERIEGRNKLIAISYKAMLAAAPTFSEEAQK